MPEINTSNKFINTTDIKAAIFFKENNEHYSLGNSQTKNERKVKENKNGSIVTSVKHANGGSEMKVNIDPFSPRNASFYQKKNNLFFEEEKEESLKIEKEKKSQKKIKKKSNLVSEKSIKDKKKIVKKKKTLKGEI